MPAAGCRVTGGGSVPVVVVSDQLLVADAVAAALNARGLRARLGRWPAVGADRPGPVATQPKVGVALVEAATAEDVTAVGALFAGGDIAWIAIPSPSAALALGAALDVSGVIVLPHRSSLADLVEAARTATRSADPPPRG